MSANIGLPQPLTVAAPLQNTTDPMIFSAGMVGFVFFIAWGMFTTGRSGQRAMIPGATLSAAAMIYALQGRNG